MDENTRSHGPDVMLTTQDINSMTKDFIPTLGDSFVPSAFPWPEQDHRFVFDSRWTAVEDLVEFDCWWCGWVSREAAVTMHRQIIWKNPYVN